MFLQRCYVSLKVLGIRCRHACIVPLLAISTGPHLCLVMPLMDKSLEIVLQDERQREACTPAQRVRYACDIFTGIAYP